MKACIRIIGTVALVVTLPSLSTSEAGSFFSTGPLNTARSRHAASLLPDGTVLVVSGANVSTAEIYDPDTGAWSNAGVAAGMTSATLLTNGQVLLVSDSGSVSLYDPAAGTFTPTNSLTVAHSGHTATLLPDGKVLVVGGTNTTDLYDPTSGTWTNTGPLVTARYNHTATLLPNGKVLIAGGSGGRLPSPAYCELYDPMTGVFTNTGALIIPRWDHTATLLPNGKVLAAGGWQNGVGTVTAAELYDPIAGTWTNTAALNIRRSGHTATLLPSGRVLVASGSSENDYSQTFSAELYDPATGTWTLTGSLLARRTHHTATLLQDGRVLIAGGWFWGGPNGTYIASAELYVSPAPISLTGAALPGGSEFQCSFTNTPGLGFSALWTTNPAAPLTDWSVLGDVLEVTPGEFMLTDHDATNSPQRYYRVREK